MRNFASTNSHISRKNKIAILPKQEYNGNNNVYFLGKREWRCFMNKTCVSKKIAKYIKENQLSIKHIVMDTGISEAKILNENNEGLNATEFLEICFYLNLRPEDIMTCEEEE